MYRSENYAKTHTSNGFEIQLAKNWESKFLLFITSPSGHRRMVAKYDDLSVANREYNKTVTLY